MQANHTRATAELTHQLEECPFYLTGASVHQEVEPSRSELLYYSSWRVISVKWPEPVTEAITEAIDEWHARWKLQDMKKLYPTSSAKELQSDEKKRSP